MTQNTPGPNIKSLLKKQILLAGLGALVFSLVCFALDCPFPKVISGIALLAAAGYFVFYFFFDRICGACYARAGVALSVTGVLLLTLAVHFSGGIVSPFVFLYFCILIYDALYGFETPFPPPLAITGYLLVVAGEFSGFLSSANSGAVDVYRSYTATFLIAAVTTANLALTRRITRLIVDNWRVRIEQQDSQKDALLRKFSELNSTMQIGVLAHRIAHDLRTPIACISGYIEMEMAGKKSAEEMEVLKDLNETVSGMAESLHGITRFGKAGGATCERIPLRDFVRDLLAIAAFSPQAKGVKFEVSAPGKNDIAVKASRADLQQAYFNIIKNALEAASGAPGGKKIEITIKQEGKEARVSISDNGPGITEDVLKALFVRSITTKKDGTGVGLLITRDLLVRNGGWIKLQNRAGGGLTAVTSLPSA